LVAEIESIDGFSDAVNFMRFNKDEILNIIQISGTYYAKSKSFLAIVDLLVHKSHGSSTLPAFLDTDSPELGVRD
jgi:hypothetical protein